MSRKINSLIVAAVLTFAMSGAAWAAGSWSRVIVVKTDNVSAYTQELEKGRALIKKMNVQVTTRVWRAVFAGSSAGTVIVTQEFPTWAALSAYETKSTTDPEYMAWLAGLDKIRTIVSDSIYREL